MHDLLPSMPRHIDKEPALVGIGQASTFTGFCSYHDDTLFAPLEKEAFAGSPQQVALLGYRAISHELFVKKANTSLTPTMRNLDRGHPSRVQRDLQIDVSAYQSGVTKAVEELEGIKRLHDEMLLTKDFSALSYYIVRFEDSPELLCNAIHQATHDFRGKLIQELGHLDRPSQWVAFSLIATDVGGAAVFSWLHGHTICEEFINTLDELPDDELPHAIVRFTFEFFENTYFSPEWWDKLAKPVHRNLMERQMRDIPPTFQFPRPDGCLLDDGVRAVDWKVQSRYLHLFKPI